MAPVDEKRPCGTPPQNELYNLIGEAERSPLASMVNQEIALLRPYAETPERVEAESPLQLARENLQDFLEMAPTPDYLFLTSGDEGLRACLQTSLQKFSEARRVYHEKAEPRQTTSHCKECQFTAALPLSEVVFDPNGVKTTYDLLIFQNLYAGLLVPNGFGPYEFGLADRYEVSKDGKTYTIHLREGAHWSDGTEIASADLLFAIQRHLTPSNGSLHAPELFPIENGKAYFEGNLRDFGQVGVHVLDSRTVQIRLARPYPLFVHALASPALTPLPRHAIKGNENYWQSPSHFVVSGAYSVSDYKYGNLLTLSSNLRYFRAGEVQFGYVVIHHAGDPQAGYHYFRAGKVQYAMQVPLVMATSLLREGSQELQVGERLCLYMYQMNTQRIDSKQRRALVLSFDRQTLVRQVLGLGQKAATSFVPPSLWESLGDPPGAGSYLPYDPNGATELLGSHPIKRGLQAIYDNTADHKTIAEFLQRQMKEQGIPLEIFAMETKAMLDARNRGEYDLVRLGWCADYPDPYDFLRIFVTGDENNHSLYSNLTFDAKIKAAEVETDPKKRKQLLHEAEAILTDDPPAIPFYYNINFYLLDSKIGGLKPDWRGLFLFERLRQR